MDRWMFGEVRSNGSRSHLFFFLFLFIFSESVNEVSF